MKKCSKCKKTKFLNEFHKDKAKKDGYHGKCKICRKLINQARYLNNKKRLKEINKAWRLNNKKRKSETNKAWYKNNKTKINLYWQNRRNTEPEYRIKRNLRGRIRRVLRDNCKSDRTMNLVSCTIENLKKYLENLFVDGMSWDNYGFYGWQIDHIMPCASFDLTNEEEQKKCFHYTNLQPLWAFDNISKGAKIL